MKKYLLWKSQAESSLGSPPALLEASPAPSTSLCLPTISAETGCEAGLLSGDLERRIAAGQGWSEMGGVEVGSSAMCSPVLLDRLGPHILRSNVPTAHYKSIPSHGPSVDLEGWAAKEVGAWGMDDVIAWIIAVARKHHIPVEDMNMHRFANCSGPLLMLMSQQHFLDRDAVYGYLLYMEFRKLVGDDTNILDDWIRSYRAGEVEAAAASASATPRLVDLDGRSDGGGPELSPQLSPNAGLSAMLSAGAPLRSPPLRLDPQQPTSSFAQSVSSSSLVGVGSASSLGAAGGKIRRNKDGKPRKRSQHNKGNKLWEFIRDALKDPATCPSVVRWEDAKEGVFRIVESERLARLWGERKNNTKMTYEKLSRAMRYYYNTKILLPVSGRRLVYKFGPNAVGWRGGPLASSGPLSGLELPSGGSSVDLWEAAAPLYGHDGGGSLFFPGEEDAAFAQEEEEEDEEDGLQEEIPVQIHLGDPGSLLLA